MVDRTGLAALALDQALSMHLATEPGTSSGVACARGREEIDSLVRFLAVECWKSYFSTWAAWQNHAAVWVLTVEQQAVGLASSRAGARKA